MPAFHRLGYEGFPQPYPAANLATPQIGFVWQKPLPAGIGFVS
jgi:hypothetical protein